MNPPEPVQKQKIKRVYLSYYDGIDLPKVNAVVAAINNILQQADIEELYFLLSSNGGHVDAGITLYNHLRSIPQKIIMHNMGSIDSIATVVFMAGEERYAQPNSTFLFHGVELTTGGPISVSRSKMMELVSSIDADQEKIIGIITERTTVKKEELSKFFSEGSKKDLIFAQNKGIIHGIVPLSIEKDVPLISFNFQQINPQQGR